MISVVGLFTSVSSLLQFFSFQSRFTVPSPVQGASLPPSASWPVAGLGTDRKDSPWLRTSVHHCPVPRWLGFQNPMVLCEFQTHKCPPIQSDLCEVSGSSSVPIKPGATCMERTTALGDHWPGVCLASQSGESCKGSFRNSWREGQLPGFREEHLSSQTTLFAGHYGKQSIRQQRVQGLEGEDCISITQTWHGIF